MAKNIDFAVANLTTDKKGVRTFLNDIEVPTFEQMRDFDEDDRRAYELRLKALDLNVQIRQANLLEKINWGLFCLRQEQD